ncbi:MAG: hypothetical protein ABI851_12550 [Saprospiraceae bacterium]
MNSNLEKIEKYLDGDLFGSELAEFEEALQKDHSLSEAVAQHLEMKARLEALRLRKKVNAILDEESNKKFVLINYRRVLSIAASILVLVIATWVFYPTKEKPLLTVDQNTIDSLGQSRKDSTKSGIAVIQPDSTYKIDSNTVKKISGFTPLFALVSSLIILPNELTLRSNDETNDTPQKNELDLAIIAHSKKEYQSAIGQLNKLENINTVDEAVFLRGSSYFMTQQFALSLKDFKHLSKSLQYKQEALWNELLAQIMLQNKMEVDNTLNLMIEDLDYPYRDKALKIKRKLKGIGFPNG